MKKNIAGRHLYEKLIVSAARPAREGKIQIKCCEFWGREEWGGPESWLGSGNVAALS